MSALFQNPVSPYPGWEHRVYHLSRPVTQDDVSAFLGDQDLYIRETASGPVNIIHKYGLLEIHCITGESEVEVWFNPDRGAYPSEYLDALFMTRFN
jgi:hypothetical protein